MPDYNNHNEMSFTTCGHIECTSNNISVYTKIKEYSSIWDEKIFAFSRQHTKHVVTKQSITKLNKEKNAAYNVRSNYERSEK